jgi:hypothetical protein
MPSYLERLRLQNIFNPVLGNDLPSQGGFDGTMFGGQIAPNPAGDIYAATAGPLSGDMFTPDPNQFMKQSAMPAAAIPASPAEAPGAEYIPQHEATDKYNEAIANYPQYEKPGWWRAIAGALTAFGPGGHELGMRIANWNNIRKMEDWKNTIGPLQQAANLERYENVNNRNLAYQTNQAALAQRKLDLKDANDKARLRIQQLKAEGAKQFDFKGPTVMVGYADGRVVDTGIPTQHLSDADRIEANAKAQQAVAETKANTPFMITDPNDPTKTIAVRYNPVTNKMDRVELEGQGVASLTKPGGPGKGTTQNVALESIKAKAQETLQALDEVLDPKTNALNPDVASTVGGSRLFQMHRLPATSARAGEAAVNRLKSLLIVDLIGEMKAQSKTGATGFGQLNMKELAVLENAASKLDPGLDEATFTNELKRIKSRLQKIVQPETTTPPTSTPLPKPDETTAAPSAAPNLAAPAAAPKLSARDLINKYSTQSSTPTTVAAAPPSPPLTAPPPMRPAVGHTSQPARTGIPQNTPQGMSQHTDVNPRTGTMTVPAENRYARQPAGIQTAPNRGGEVAGPGQPTGVETDKVAQATRILRQNGIPATPENIQNLILRLQAIERTGAE